MALTIYATASDLTAWVQGTTVTPPDDPSALLRSASLVVAKACNRNPYTDQPTVTDAPTLRDATTAQAAAWLTLGIAPSAAGLDRSPVKRTSIDQATVELDTSGLLEATADAAVALAPEAEAILQAAGLLWRPAAQLSGQPTPSYLFGTDPLGQLPTPWAPLRLCP